MKYLCTGVWLTKYGFATTPSLRFIEIEDIYIQDYQYIADNLSVAGLPLAPLALPDHVFCSKPNGILHLSKGTDYKERNKTVNGLCGEIALSKPKWCMLNANKLTIEEMQSLVDWFEEESKNKDTQILRKCQPIIERLKQCLSFGQVVVSKEALDKLLKLLGGLNLYQNSGYQKEIDDAADAVEQSRKPYESR